MPSANVESMLVKVGVPLSNIYPTVHDALAKNAEDVNGKQESDDPTLENGGISEGIIKESGIVNEAFENEQKDNKV